MHRKSNRKNINIKYTHTIIPHDLVNDKTSFQFTKLKQIFNIRTKPMNFFGGRMYK